MIRIHRVSNSKLISRNLTADTSSVVKRKRDSYLLSDGSKYKLKNGLYYHLRPSTK